MTDTQTENSQDLSSIEHEESLLFLIFQYSLSILIGILFAVFLMWLYGFFALFPIKEYLYKKSLFIQSVGGLPLPSADSLKNLNAGFLFECGAFLGLALGIPLGSFFCAIIFISNVSFKFLKKNLIYILILSGIATWHKAGQAYYPIASLFIFLSLPFFVYLGYLIPPQILKKYKPFFKKIDYFQIPKNLTFKKFFHQKKLIILSFLFLLGTGFLYSKARSTPIDYIKIRDNFLINNKLGNLINNFYYTHSPLPAESIKPLKQKRQITLLFIGKNPNYIEEFKRYGNYLHYYFKVAHSKNEITEVVRGGGIDFVLIEEDIKDKNGNDLYKFFSQSFHEISKRRLFFVLKEEGSLKNDFFNIKPPLSYNKLSSAVKHISAYSDYSKELRQFLKLLLFDLIQLNLGLIFCVIILFVASISFTAFRVSYLSKFRKIFLFIFFIFITSAAFKAFFIIRKNQKNNQLHHTLLKLIESNDLDTFLNYLGHSDDHVRYQAASLTPKITKKKKDQRFLNPLLDGLDDNDPRVRMYSATSLGNLKNNKAISKLVAKLNDPQINVRYKSVEALGKIKDRRAIKPLRKIIEENKNWYVSDYAFNALRRIR